MSARNGLAAAAGVLAMTLCGSLGAACGSTSVVETTEPSEGDRAEYRQQAADEINDVNALDKSSELEREIDSDDE